jgi:hypothetical protein
VTFRAAGHQQPLCEMLPVIAVKSTALCCPRFQDGQSTSLFFLDHHLDKRSHLRKPSNSNTAFSKSADSLEIEIHSLPPANDGRRTRPKMNAGSSSMTFTRRQQSLAFSSYDITRTSEVRTSKSSDHSFSPKLLQYSAPSTPHDRSPHRRDIPENPSRPAQSRHKAMPRTASEQRHSISASSSCLSSSDTTRIRGICSSPATPRGRSGGCRLENANQTGSSEEVAVGIADALRGKLERALSASLSEVNRGK